MPKSLIQSVIGQLQKEHTRLEDELRVSAALTAFGRVYLTKSLKQPFRWTSGRGYLCQTTPFRVPARVYFIVAPQTAYHGSELRRGHGDVFHFQDARNTDFFQPMQTMLMAQPH